MEEDKKHWFCFSFHGKLIDTGHDCSASTYTGYNDKNVTLDMINKNKEFAGVSEKAVLVSLSYLGFMTKKEFSGE